MPASHDTIKIALSVTNCICYDQRVLKIAETVRDLNCDITIIGRRLGNCCEHENVPFRTQRFRMLFRRGFLFYSFFNIRLFFYLLFNRYDILVANDLDTLLPNFLVAGIKRLPLVYDSHEYFTGVPELQNRPFVKGVWTAIEKAVFTKLKNVMTVSDSIAAQYEFQYKIRPLTIRNCARSAAGIEAYTKHELAIPADHLLLILQGGGINIDRGGEELIESVSNLDGVSLIIAGSGDVIEILKEKAINLNSFDRIRFIPKLSWEELMRYTKAADAGLTLDKDTNTNYHFSLPNKLFDYISAGIAVIAGNLPEVKKILDKNNCGILIPSVTPHEIINAIKKLRDDKVLLDRMKQNAIYAFRTLNWDSESRKVYEYYSEIISPKRASNANKDL